MKLTIISLIVALALISCSSDSSNPTSENSVDFLYTEPFINEESESEIVPLKSAAAAIVSAVVGVTKFISGRIMKIVGSGKPDPYMNALDDVKDQIANLTKLVNSMYNEMGRRFTSLEQQAFFKPVEDSVEYINNAGATLGSIAGCLRSTREDPIPTCQKEVEDFSATFADNPLGIELLSLNSSVLPNVPRDGVYAKVTELYFDIPVRDGNLTAKKAAIETFLCLMYMYTYISTAQLEGYMVYLNYYNYKNKIDSDDLPYRPQVYVDNMANQTKAFLAEIEKISSYGLMENAVGTRMDYGSGESGWTNWFATRVKDTGRVDEEEKPVYEGDQFYMQADALAAAVNGWGQLLTARAVWDFDSPEYAGLADLKSGYERLNENSPPVLTLTAQSLGAETVILDGSYAEKVILESLTDDNKKIRLWRYMNSEVLLPYQWRNQISPLCYLQDISVLDEENIWAVGYCHNTYEPIVLFYDGDQWQEQTEVGNQGLHSVFALDAEHVWAVGNSGTVLFYDGKQWIVQESGVTANLLSVSASSSNKVWAVGDRGTIIHFDGETWRTQESGITRLLNGVSVLNALQVWAVGTDGNILYYNGEEWVSQDSGTTTTLYDVSAMNYNHVWAVGNNGTVLFYDGEKWVREETDTTKTLHGVTHLGERNVWVAGSQGEILFFNGKTWQSQSADTKNSLYGIDGIGGNVVWTVGILSDKGTVLRRVEDIEYNPLWKASSSYKINRSAGKSRKAWGENLLADQWLLGGNLDEILAEKEYAYLNTFSLPFLAYLPECIMKDAFGNFAFKSSALVPNQHINLIGEEDRYLRERKKVSTKYIRYQVITSPGCLDYCVWEMLPNLGTGNVLACKASYYIQNTHFKHYVENTWTTYGGLRNILVSTSPTSAGNGFSIYNAVSSNVIKLLDLNDSLVFQNDDIFLYNPDPEPYGIITYEVGVGGYIRAKSLPNILDTKNITDKNNGYFPSKWKITAASSN